MYVLDASVVIAANDEYYPIDRVPEFWDWLAEKAGSGDIKTPREVLNEITPSDGPLNDWLKKHFDSLLLEDEEYLKKVPDILELYATDLSEAEVEGLGGDPFLVAAAWRTSGTVVTKEVSSPRRQRANRTIPDVCKDAKVRCINDHELIRELDFRTSWKAR